MSDPWISVKETIGTYAAALVPKVGTVGLGSGSTATCFIIALAKRFRKESLAIRCLPTSQASKKLAASHGLPLIDELSWDGTLDVTFDGADIVQPDGSAIKGAGGALLREKIVASASKKLILMVDERKLTEQDKILLPITITPFGAVATLHKIERCGYTGELRKKGTDVVISDDGHWIVDVEFDRPLSSWKEAERELKSISGVVETGIFYKMASEAIVGRHNGEIVRQKFERSL